MAGTENETDGLEPPDVERTETPAAETVFGSYSVVSPGVQIVLDGRAVSAPAPD